MRADNISGEKEITEFFLPKDLNHFCTGCYSCVKDEKKCPYYEEKSVILEKIEKADLLIFTTPNYFSLRMKSMFNLIAVKQKQDAAGRAEEKKYWEEQGWLGKKRPWKKA